MDNETVKKIHRLFGGDLEHVCSICAGAKNMTTSMDMIVSGEKFRVSVCKDCIDEASIRTILDSTERNISEINELVKKIEYYGLKVAGRGSVIADPQQPKPAQPVVVAKGTAAPTVQRDGEWKTSNASMAAAIPVPKLADVDLGPDSVTAVAQSIGESKVVPDIPSINPDDISEDIRINKVSTEDLLRITRYRSGNDTIASALRNCIACGGDGFKQLKGSKPVECKKCSGTGVTA